MFVLVSYDIEKDWARNKVANILKDYGERVQYSVFECDVTTALFEDLCREIGEVPIGKRDSIRYYFLCRRCVDRISGR